MGVADAYTLPSTCMETPVRARFGSVPACASALAWVLRDRVCASID